MAKRIETCNKAYMKAIRKLQAIIKADYEEGGWLPPGREMAKRLGVCHRTYCKALDRMTEESFVRSFPGKGHMVVPSRFRCRKIGIVLRDGSSSPFIDEFPCFEAAIRLFYANGFHFQLIQGTRMDQLLENAVAHGVEGLFWFCPPPDAVPFLDEIASKGEMPLVAVDVFNAVGSTRACLVRFDTESETRMIAEKALARGRGKFLLANGSADFVRALAAAGVDASCVGFYKPRCSVDFFKESFSNGSCDFLIAIGDFEDCVSIFAAASELPPEKRPDLFFPWGILNRIVPEVSRGVKFLCLSPERTLGEEGADILVARLLRGVELKSRLVKPSVSSLRVYDGDFRKEAPL